MEERKLDMKPNKEQVPELIAHLAALGRMDVDDASIVMHLPSGDLRMYGDRDGISIAMNLGVDEDGAVMTSADWDDLDQATAIAVMFHVCDVMGNLAVGTEWEDVEKLLTGSFPQKRRMLDKNGDKIRCSNEAGSFDGALNTLLAE
jgi:hypothetical protein